MSGVPPLPRLATWAPPIAPPLPPAAMEGTEGFRDLYEKVTDALLKTAQHSPPPEGEFLRFLIFGFWREYVAWKLNIRLLNYLAKFRTRSKFKAFATIGHAYLHMAYDLPRTVADSIEIRPPLPLPDAQKAIVFLRVWPKFEDVFEACSRDRRVFGVLAIPCKLLGRRAALLRKESAWIQRIRTVAWVHGTILADHPQRQMHEGRLLDMIVAAGDEAIKYYLNPLYWTAILAPPVLLAIPFLPAQITGWIGHHWAAAGAGIAAATGAYFYGVYRGLVRVTQKLGYALYRVHLRLIEELDGLDRLREFSAQADEFSRSNKR